MPAGQRSKEGCIGIPWQDLVESKNALAACIQTTIQESWVAVAGTPLWRCPRSQVSSERPRDLISGGNNTVALAPYFESVQAVEINRTLAQAAEDS